MTLLLLVWALLLPVLPARAHHALPHHGHPRYMCPFVQPHCPPGPIPGK